MPEDPHQRLPYAGFMNTMRNDCMSGIGRARQRWVNLIRKCKQSPNTIGFNMLPQPFQSKLTLVQATLVLSALSPTR